MTITSLALELPRKSVKHSLVTVSSYRSATSYKNVLSSRDRLALTLQQSTDRLNNHSRSLGSLELIIKKQKSVNKYMAANIVIWANLCFGIGLEGFSTE